MAELEGLYLGMGIDTSQLHSDFLNAEKTINQNLRRINQEMEMIQLRGQLELEGLDESASQLEKVRIQEEALTRQMELQQDKILMLNKAHEYLVQTQGENAQASRQVELQLQREQYAMQKLETQMDDLANQTKVVFDMNMEVLTMIEPAFKAIESRAAAGLALPLALAPGQAKAAVAGLAALSSAIVGTHEATEELREENPAQLIDEDLQRLSGSIDNSWQKINESNRRGMEQMRSYNNGYYRNNHKNNYYNRGNQDLQNYNEATKEQVEQTKEITKEIEEVKKEQENVIEEFLTGTLGIKKDQEGGLKILPTPERDDLIRLSKIFEDYRFSEAFVNVIDLVMGADSAIGKLAATIVGFEYLSSKAREPIVEFAQAALENFRELSKVANELNIPLERANDLLGEIALAGADYEDVRDYVRGVQDAVIKGDSEDPEVLALEKYGVVIQDANGKLLAFDETLDRLYQGFLKAKEAGEAEGYVMMTNGQSVHDVLPYFEKLAQAKEDVAKIKWSTLDAATLSNVSHEMTLLEVQTNEFKNALASLAAPAAEIGLQKMFEQVKGYTELIEENRDTVIYWSYVLMEALNKFDEFTKGISDGVKEKFVSSLEELKRLNEEYDITGTLQSFFSEEPAKDIGEEARESLIPFYDVLKKLEEEFGAISKIKQFLPEGFTEEIDNAINEYLVPFYEKIKEIKESLSITNKLKSFLPDDFFNVLLGEGSIFARAQKDFDEFKKANEEARQQAKETEEYLAGLSYSLNRIAKYKEELANLNLDIEFGSGDSYQKKIEQNKIWYETAMKDAKHYADEQAAIDELNSAKLLLIEQEKEEKLAEIRERIASADRSELEKRMADIEKEKESWIQAGMEKAEAEPLAEKQKADYIGNIEQELSEKINSIRQSSFEQKLAQIEKEKQAWLDKGASEAQAEQLAQEQILQANQEKEEKLNSIRESVASLFRSDIENRIAAVEREKQAWIEAGMEKAEAEELAAQKTQKLIEDNAAKEQDNREQQAKAWEQYYEQLEAAAEEAERKNKALRDEALNTLKSEAEEFKAYMQGGYEGLRKYRYDQLIKSGVEPKALEKMTPELLEDYKKAKEEADKSFLPSWSDPYSPERVEPPDFSEVDKASKTTAKSLDEVSEAAQDAADSLNQISGGEPYDSGSSDSDRGAPVAVYQQPDGTPIIKNYYPEGYNEPQIYEPYGGNSDEIAQDFSAMEEAAKNVTSALSEIPTVIETGIPSVVSEFDETAQAVQGATAAVSDLQENLSVNPFSKLEPETQNVIQNFSGLNSGFSEVTVRLSDLSQALANFSLPTQNQSAEQKQPVEVTNNISIEEAHAWDYDHIAELADKVAEIIEPRIISAIGGDSNSY